MEHGGHGKQLLLLTCQDNLTAAVETPTVRLYLGNYRSLTESFNSHCGILCCCVESLLLKKSGLLDVLCLGVEIALESLPLSSFSVWDPGRIRTGSRHRLYSCRYVIICQG